MNQTKTFLGILLVLAVSNAGAEAWEPVTGADKLSALFNDTVMTATLKKDVTAIATYNRDGSGELEAWGDTFPRAWQVKGDKQVCIEIDEQTQCFRIEKDAGSDYSYMYKAFLQDFIAVVDKYPPEKGFAAPTQNSNGGDIWGVARVLEDEYGWSEDEIRGFLGENLMRVYEANWE